MVVHEATHEVFLEQLRDLSPERLLAAVRRHVRESRFFPTVAELRALAVQEPCPHPRWAERESHDHEGKAFKYHACAECGVARSQIEAKR
jgi:hypothetical protein